MLRSVLVVSALAACGLIGGPPTASNAQTDRSHSEEEIGKVVVQFESREDRFNGTTVRSLKKPVTLKREGGIGFPLILADLKTVTSGSDTVMGLQVIYYAKRWAFLTGEATVLLNDGSRLNLGGEDELVGRPGREVENTGIREVATFRLSCTQLARLAAARGIEIRLHGDKTNVDAWFPREGIAALRTMRVEVGCPPLTHESTPAE